MKGTCFCIYACFFFSSFRCSIVCLYIIYCVECPHSISHESLVASWYVYFITRYIFWTYYCTWYLVAGVCILCLSYPAVYVFYTLNRSFQWNFGGSYERTDERTEAKIVRTWRATWMAIKIFKLLELRTVVKRCDAIFLEGSTGHTVVQSRALALVRGLKLHARHNSPRTTLSESLISIWALVWLYNINYISRQEWVGKAWRAHGFVPSRGFPQAWTRTPLSRPFRHRFDPVQASILCASEPVAFLAWS